MTDFKKKAAQIIAYVVIFVMLLTDMLMFVPSNRTSSTEDDVVEISKETTENETLSSAINKITSRSGILKREIDKIEETHKEKFVIYEFIINKEKTIYFDNFDKADYQKDYLLRNTEGVTVEIVETEREDNSSLSSEFAINNTVENYILKYKKVEKKSTTNRAANSTRVEKSSASTSGTCYPTVSKTISSNYGGRSGSFHTGIDISGNYGDNIYAYKSGTVVKTQYSNRSYGNMVLITHNDGSQTRYAHMSSISVNNGQAVSCGQIIGHVGSTGNSTGNHLHFEVIINGSTVNPYNYIF